jgi:hypothetical protein
MPHLCIAYIADPGAVSRLVGFWRLGRHGADCLTIESGMMPCSIPTRWSILITRRNLRTTTSFDCITAPLWPLPVTESVELPPNQGTTLDRLSPRADIEASIRYQAVSKHSRPRRNHSQLREKSESIHSRRHRRLRILHSERKSQSLGFIRAGQGSRHRHLGARSIRRRLPGKAEDPLRDNPRHGRLPYHSPDEIKNDGGSRSRAEVLLVLHDLPAISKCPDRRRPYRPAVQFKRATSRAASASPGGFWQGRRHETCSRHA